MSRYPTLEAANRNYVKRETVYTNAISTSRFIRISCIFSPL